MKIEKCPYCNSDVELKDSSIIYGMSYGLVYICSKYPGCDAYVGVHEGTEEPLGTLANVELRECRKQAHAAFDKLWKSGSMTRKAAYTKLMIAMNLGKKEAHIAKMNIDQCKKVLEVFKSES